MSAFGHREADYCDINVSRLQSLDELRRGFFPELRVDTGKFAREIADSPGNEIGRFGITPMRRLS